MRQCTKCKKVTDDYRCNSCAGYPITTFVNAIPKATGLPDKGTKHPIVIKQLDAAFFDRELADVIVDLVRIYQMADTSKYDVKIAFSGEATIVAIET